MSFVERLEWELVGAAIAMLAQLVVRWLLRPIWDRLFEVLWPSR